MVKQTGSFILRKTNEGTKYWEGFKEKHPLKTNKNIILDPNNFKEQTLIRIFEPIKKS